MADLFVVPKIERPPDDANDGRIPDWGERERALDVQRSWIIEAPAGSGKTGLLIQRYLKLLADESVEEPAQVLAITFTVKATAEMRERIMAQLESAARREPVKRNSDFDLETRALAEAVLRRDEQLGWNLLAQPRRLRIRTIDSLCSEIAQSLPVLSGSGGRQNPVTDPTSMYRDAARQTLMQLGGNDAELDAALHTLLLHRDGSLSDCERLLMEMLPLRNQWGELVPLGKQELNDDLLDTIVLPKLERALEQAVCAGLTRLSRTIPGDVLWDLAKLASEMGYAEGYKGAPSPIALCAGVSSAPQETAEHLAHWRALIHLLTTQEPNWRATTKRNHLGFEIEKKHAEELRLLIDLLRSRNDVLEAVKQVKALPPIKYPPEQWIVAKALFRVLSRALVELQIIFARREECDFAELGLLAQVALEHDGGADDLNEALGMRLRHLLVDEMQDTSTTQYELIRLLTQGWDGHSQTVFLVGDPKQSIYLFRQARVERFVRTMQTERLGDLPVGRLQLTANFRSQRDLVDEFNEDFSLLFPPEINRANPDEVPYVKVQAVRGPSQNGSRNVVWHTHVLDAGLPPDEAKRARRQQARTDALSVREIIAEWRARPLPVGRREPWKIAVLVSSRNLLVDIVAELKDETRGAIPFRAVDIEALGERQEVLDLFALTRALLHPADRVAWLAVLHAPWCGLGLADLHMLAGADDPEWAERCIEDVIAERGDLLSEESCARLMQVWPVLKAATGRRSELTMAQSVDRTWRSLGGDVYLKNTEMANARRYLQALDEVEENGEAIDLGLLKRRLTSLYAETAAGADAVDLMTIHGAKGLEWDVVIVPGLEKKAQVNREKLLTWNEIDSNDAEAAPIVLAPIVSRGESSRKLNDWLKGIAKAREAAERKRLFYVACTRAREELHLFASPEATARGKINRQYGSLLATAWPAAERHFASALTPTSEAAPKPLAMLAPETKGNFVGDIAARSDESVRPTILQRLPSEFEPRARFMTKQKLSYGEDLVVPGLARFERPEGSFEARAFGNAVHAFLEILSKRLSDGTSVDALSHEIAEWSPRIKAALRGDGLPPAVVERLVPRVKAALNNTLQKAEGLWVLSAHNEASSEYGLTSWAERRSSVRLDRVFFAGSEPLNGGNDYLWIIDYKTSTHGREGVDELLAKERLKYGPQMEAYARMMHDRVQAGRLCVGLYYPALPRLVWWRPELTSPGFSD